MVSCMATTEDSTIGRIFVEKLFGRYTYDINVPVGSNVVILHGENGSGKTTILDIVFHLLSPERHHGHRTAIGRIAFGRAEISLGSGLTVFAARKSPGYGSYRYGITRHDKTLHATQVAIDDDGDIISSSKFEKELDAILDILIGIVGTDIYYISDDRRIGNQRISRRPASDTWHLGETYFAPLKVGHEPSRRRTITSDPRNDDLDTALSRAKEWSSRRAFGAASQGTANTNTIYADVVKRIVAPPLSPEESTPSVVDLLERIEALEERNLEYEPYGLDAGFARRDLHLALAQASPDFQSVIVGILKPYLDSVEARLEAVASLQSKLSTFVSWMDKLLKDKTVTFEVPWGMKIFTDSGQELEYEVLSSGEKHLLMLLASTLYAQEESSLFIIDEPELSLNIRWQRCLLDALRDCAADGNMQFILATHSMELLTGHEENVVTLQDTVVPGDERLILR